MTSKGGAGSSTLDAVESGIDLVLACGVGFALQSSLAGRADQSRPLEAISRVLRGLLLKIVMSSVSSRDNSLYLAHLLCMFLLLHAFKEESVGSTAKYIFASQIASTLAGDPFVGAGLCAALQANMGLLASMPRLQECSQLVVVQLVVRWFQDSIPHGMEFATTLLFMHLITPMLGQTGASRLLTEMYNLALYKASETIQLPGKEAWVRATYAALLWRMAPDPVSRLVGQFCSIQVVSLMVLDAGASMLRTDPILSAWMILTGLGLVLLLIR